ncbi:hypothetical protein ACFFIX_25470 [Metabacillus herbersteinensis]|uniref:Uncharacterized protein n=1 Tax=Metabacillus herbersteinensis TaxID=283816 RepID=A0ABV6GLV8_9BACI
MLNIDFIYKQTLPEWFEFLMHLVVAVGIGIFFMYSCEKFQLSSFKKRLLFSFGLTMPTLFLYFPLTLLAIKDTPALFDWISIIWWSVGHCLFAVVLAIASFQNK